MSKLTRLSVQWIAVAVFALSGVGCISQTQYDDLDKLYRTQVEENEKLKEDLRQARAMIQALRDSMNQETARVAEQLAIAQAEVERLEGLLRQAEEALKSARVGDLPAALDEELRRLAEQYPGLMTYDPRLGMIRLSSDLTFDPGSDVVNARAQESLRKLAEILNGGLASAYQLQIVGHTDNVPIRASIAKHPTNWHLSAHRAISVMKVLAAANVSEPRFKVAGRGEYEPIEPNGPNGSRANRRVEIFLVGQPATGAPGAASGATGGAASPAPDMGPAAEPAPAAEEPAESFK